MALAYDANRVTRDVDAMFVPHGVVVEQSRAIFAMKALAARTRDIDDLRSLAALVGVHTVDDALRICRDFYPDEEITSRGSWRA